MTGVANKYYPKSIASRYDISLTSYMVNCVTITTFNKDVIASIGSIIIVKWLSFDNSIVKSTLLFSVETPGDATAKWCDDFHVTVIWKLQNKVIMRIALCQVIEIPLWEKCLNSTLHYRYMVISFWRIR